MTTQQIQYQQLQEAKRHNMETEEDTDVSNKETNRHNVVGELQAKSTLAETKRHNEKTESQTDRDLDRKDKEFTRDTVLKSVSTATDVFGAATKAFVPTKSIKLTGKI